MFPRCHFPPPRQGKRPILLSAELGLKPLPRVSAPCLHSTIQRHQASLDLFPVAVHCMWGLHGHGPGDLEGHMALEGCRRMQGSRSQARGTREPQERICLRDYEFPNFCGISVAPPSQANYLFSQVRLTDTFHMPPLLHWTRVHLPFVGPFPQWFAGNGLVGPWSINRNEIINNFHQLYVKSLRIFSFISKIALARWSSF